MYFYLLHVHMILNIKNKEKILYGNMMTYKKTQALNQYMAGLEAIMLFPGRGKKTAKEWLFLEASSISTAGNTADSALCSTWLPSFTKLTATKMSVYCSPAEQDKLTDGPLHSNRSRGGTSAW